MNLNYIKSIQQLKLKISKKPKKIYMISKSIFYIVFSDITDLLSFYELEFELYIKLGDNASAIQSVK